MANNLQKIYADIDFTFTKKPVVGDIALSYDSQAVIRSVRNLIFTKHYDRPYNPNLGTLTENILFEPMSGSSAAALESEITNIINNYEPRARINYINVTPVEIKNSYEVTVSFYIANDTMPTNVTIILERTR
jgi:phage baseplate assembly protein W